MSATDPLPRREIGSSFLSFHPQPGVTTCLIILNHTLPHATARLWKHAAYKVCADGGSNRLYDSLPAMLGLASSSASGGSSSNGGGGGDAASAAAAAAAVAEARASHLPDVIVGDLDSLREDTRAFYTGHGVPLHDLSHDQDSTDLMKALAHLEALVLAPAAQPGGATTAAVDAPAGDSSQVHPQELLPHHIIVLGALGGRLDHTLSNLNVLYQYPHLTISLMGDGNIVRLLRPGVTNVIRPNRSLEGPACGLVPLGCRAVATSTGLRWNLADTPMEVGGLISTCNVIEADEVVVTTDAPLLWMTETPSLAP